ncbi:MULTISPECIES: efflux RND transporter periplasmic adaptor subunit [Thiomicrorhabdus]|uniref:Efflux RND transporter periplasmic adaptor subunit n=1 Tax=Thiomicrorhabdus heinhorstiae TaxID=2748010 RepID=A0ABS0BZ77_9GAMM|nr:MULTISPECIES: efflux RND transporter periplasmic adaptor subunit [Thiomicrorhabdus]MBF6058749.1 efflux RND transporter periplasmic adaptor subunit [Thiomicrorhabdus heinhorstiae]
MGTKKMKWFVSTMVWMLSGTAFAQGLQVNDLQRQAMGLETQTAQSVSQVPSALFPAEAIMPLNTLRALSSPTAGQVSEIKVVHGPVKQGETILRLQSAQLLAMQNRYLATLADLDVAKSQARRSQELYDNGVASVKRLQADKAQLRKLQTELTQQEQEMVLLGMDQARLKSLKTQRRLQSSELDLKAPVNGQLFDMKVRLGERVEANQVLFSLGEVDPIVLVVRAPLSVAKGLSEGLSVAIDGSDKVGSIAHIDPVVDSMTQTVDVHIRVENKDGEFHAGQYLKVRFLQPATQNVFQTSAQALTSFDGSNALFVDQGGQIEAVAVEVLSVADGHLFFRPVNDSSATLSVYSRGTTAIKSALEAVADPQGE